MDLAAEMQKLQDKQQYSLLRAAKPTNPRKAG